VNEQVWKWFWRAVGLIAAIFMLISTMVFWAAWRSSVFQATANGQQVQNGFDVIAIQLDILSLALLWQVCNFWDFLGGFCVIHREPALVEAGDGR
jgi:hypothetical protein